MTGRMEIAKRYEKALFAGDYTDSHIYEEFLKRHRNELPKFKPR